MAGPEVGTEPAFDFAREFHLPAMVVINKMDRENANFNRRSAPCANVFQPSLVPVMLPIGAQADSLAVNVLTQKAYKGAGKDASDLPGDMADELEMARLELIGALLSPMTR